MEWSRERARAHMDAEQQTNEEGLGSLLSLGKGRVGRGN